MKRILLSALAASLVPAFWWLGGYDFDVRGFNAVFCGVFSIYAGGAAYLFLGMK